MMNLLMLDNYDSFTYNLVQLVLENSEYKVDIFRNDEITLSEVDKYDKIILSPGPGIPKDAGILCELISRYKNSKSIFGVCLGMQAIGEVFGGVLFNIKEPMHGIATPIHHTSSPLFKNIPQQFSAGRYHSWALEAESLHEELKVTATDDEGMVMAIEHRDLDVCGVQFHPESILTEFGKNIIMNFLNKRK